MPAPRAFFITLDGQRYTGDWQLEDGILHVRTAWGSCPPTKIKTGEPETLAKIVLASAVKAHLKGRQPR